jgi:hypothetical protein
MNLRILTVLSLAIVLLTACNQEPPTVGEATAFATACDRANDGKRVAVEGYLLFPESFTGDESVVLQLYETDDFDGTPIGVTLKFGSEANQVELVSDQYTDEDLKVHLSDGQVAGFSTKVKASGKVYFPLVDQDFECGLDNVLMQPAD